MKLLKHDLASVAVFILINSILHVHSINLEGVTTRHGLTATEMDSLQSDQTLDDLTWSDSTSSDEISTTHAGPTVHPTWRPQRHNCTAPIIEQFPKPMLEPHVRKQGGLIVHILVAIFTFLGLTIVCRHYFVSSLYRICEELKLSPEVVGATFMAAGSSAPALAINTMSVFISKDYIGVSGVIGSSVINITFVILLCSGAVINLSRWPLYRNCFFYVISILLMHSVILNQVITWPKALTMLLLYVVYCVTLHFNTKLMNWFSAKREQGMTNSNETSAKQVENGLTEELAESSQPENEEPINTGPIQILSRFIVSPIHYMCRLTIPDCRTEQYRNRYLSTFLVSIIWIAFYSYFMVWMIVVIGNTLAISESVMWLTLAAAGLSIPNAINSIEIVKKGYGDMVISNAVGSNIFHVLICLGLPWFIETAIIRPGSHAYILSKGWLYSISSMLSTIIIFMLVTSLNGWKLNMRYGIILMIWFIGFVIVASLYEHNQFGLFNPPECLSAY